MDEVDKQLIGIVQPVIDMVKVEIETRGLPDTPENRIALYDEVSTEFLELLGDTLVRRIAETIINWLIEQECLNIRVFGN